MAAWAITTIPRSAGITYPRVVAGRLLVAPVDAPLLSNPAVLVLLRAELADIDLGALDRHREGLNRRLSELAPVVIALGAGLIAAVDAGLSAHLLPLAVAGEDLRSALARSLAAECLLRHHGVTPSSAPPCERTA